MKNRTIDRLQKFNNLYSPFIVTICIFTLVFTLYIIKPTYVSIFYPSRFWDCPVYVGIMLPLWKRLIILIISGTAFFPYLASLTEAENKMHQCWILFGVAISALSLLIALLALPQTTFDSWTLDTAGGELFNYRTDAKITLAQLNRLLIVNNSNVILSLELLLLGFVVSELRNQPKKRFAYIASILLLLISTISLISDFENSKIMPCFSGGCLCSVALICCISYTKDKEHHLIIAEEDGIDQKPVFVCGLLLCVMYFERVFSYRIFDSYSTYKTAGSCISLLTLIILFCYAISHRKNRQRQKYIILIMPLFFLLVVLFEKGFYFVDSTIDDKIYFSLVPYLAVNGYCFDGGRCNCLWFLEGITCTVYALYIYFDCRVKNCWVIGFVITLTIALLAYIPAFIFPLLKINSITLLDIGIGAFSPFLILLKGIRGARATQKTEKVDG